MQQTPNDTGAGHPSRISHTRETGLAPRYPAGKYAYHLHLRTRHSGIPDQTALHAKRPKRAASWPQRSFPTECLFPSCGPHIFYCRGCRRRPAPPRVWAAVNRTAIFLGRSFCRLSKFVHPFVSPVSQEIVCPIPVVFIKVSLQFRLETRCLHSLLSFQSRMDAHD